MSTQNLSAPALPIYAARRPPRSRSLQERVSGLRTQLRMRAELRSVLAGELGDGQRDEVLMLLR